MASAVQDVKARIDAIEESYRFFIGYAGQGLTTDKGAKSGAELRASLGRIEEALDGLAETVDEATRAYGTSSPLWADMVEVVRADARAALTAVRLVSAREAVSSRLIDNLNANIHLRAVLTDLFLVDELVG